MATDPNLPDDTKKSLLRRLGDSIPRIAGVAGMPMGPGVGLASWASDNPDVVSPIAARTAEADRRASTPAAPTPEPAGLHLVAGALPDEALAAGKALPGGLRRYEMDPGNEAQVYVGRGKHGETLFTDSPNSATTRQNLAGGLRRGDIGFDRTQGPNAGFEFGRNSLQRGGFDVLAGKDENGQPVSMRLAPREGLSRELMAANSPAEIQSYQDQLAASPFVDPETQAADRILSNRLQARQSGLRATAGDAASAQSAMTPAQALGIARLREQMAFHRATLDGQRETRARQDATEQRQAVGAFNDQLARLDPTASGFSQKRDQLIQQNIPRGLSKKAFGEWLDTEKGQAVSDALFNGPLRDGALAATWPLEFGDRGAFKRGEIGPANLALDPKTGDFAGFNDNSASPENEFPRVTAASNIPFNSGRDYNEGLLRSIPTDYWQVFKEKGLQRKNLNETGSFSQK